MIDLNVKCKITLNPSPQHALLSILLKYIFCSLCYFIILAPVSTPFLIVNLMNFMKARTTQAREIIWKRSWWETTIIHNHFLLIENDLICTNQNKSLHCPIIIFKLGWFIPNFVPLYCCCFQSINNSTKCISSF